MSLNRFQFVLVLLAAGCGAGERSNDARAGADLDPSMGTFDAGLVDAETTVPSDAAEMAADSNTRTTDSSAPWAFDAGPIQRICDGSQGLRFAARQVGANAHYPDMILRIGMSYIYVRGDCTFWANSAVGVLRATREGVLSSDEEQELSRDFGYGHWSQLLEAYGGGGGTSHTSFEFSDGTKRIVCGEEACLPDPDIGQTLVSRFRPSYYAWLQRMEKLGQPYSHGVRVLVRPVDDPASLADAQMRMYLLKWPFAWSLESAIGAYDSAGKVFTPPQASDLRALRDKYVRDDRVVIPGSSTRFDRFAVSFGEDPPNFNRLWFRDSIPLESDAGVIDLRVPGQ
jgi:hypothetical protein